jgi:hypothetical protein
MRVKAIWGAVVSVLLFAAPAWSQDATPICINAGHQYRVGDYACLPGCHGRQRYARCDVLGAATSWTYISDVCPIALLSPALPARASLSVATAMSPIPYQVTMSAISPPIAERISAIGKLASR